MQLNPVLHKSRSRKRIIILLDRYLSTYVYVMLSIERSFDEVIKKSLILVFRVSKSFF